MRRREDDAGDDFRPDVHPCVQAAHKGFNAHLFSLGELVLRGGFRVDGNKAAFGILRQLPGEVGQGLLPVPEHLALSEHERVFFIPVLAQRASLGVGPLDAAEHTILYGHRAFGRQQLAVAEYTAQMFFPVDFINRPDQPVRRLAQTVEGHAFPGRYDGNEAFVQLRRVLEVGVLVAEQGDAEVAVELPVRHTGAGRLHDLFTPDNLFFIAVTGT